MPKIIPALREKITEEARRILFEEKKNITIREIAKRCQVALGTIYNYYPSKEALLDAVIRQDWEFQFEHAAEEGVKAENAVEAVRCLYDSIRSLINLYRPLAERKLITLDGGRPSEEKYQQMMSIMDEKLQQMLAYHGCVLDASIMRQLLVLLFEDAMCENGSFENLLPTINKLLG